MFSISNLRKFSNIRGGVNPPKGRELTLQEQLSHSGLELPLGGFVSFKGLDYYIPLSEADFNNKVALWATGEKNDPNSTRNINGRNITLNQVYTGHQTSFLSLFYNPTNMRSINQNISEWDTSSVTHMSTMFYQSSFNGDISEWDTSSVTHMNGMFYQSSFNGDISEWDTSSVITMDNMFRESSFNGDISKWDTSSVTIMTQMFQNNKVFNQDLSQWCVIKVSSRLSFNTGATAWTLPKPVWGTCPRGEI